MRSFVRIRPVLLDDTTADTYTNTHAHKHTHTEGHSNSLANPFGARLINQTMPNLAKPSSVCI